MLANSEAEAALAHSEIVERYSYDPLTGFVSRVSGPALKQKPRRRHYRGIKIDGHQFLLHRFIWFYVHGEWPRQCIDHVNGDKMDNRLENLRLATKSQNSANFPRKVGRYGYRGVRKATRSPHKPFFAALKSSGAEIRSKQFATVEEAAVAYDDLAKQYFGPFASLNFGDGNV